MRYIVDLKEDEVVIEHYLCKKKQTLKSRNGKSYLSLVLQDKTGKIEGKVWELNNNIQSFEENDYIKIDGVVLIYQNANQLKINKIRKSKEGEYDPLDFIPCTEGNIDELFNELTGIINSLENNYVRELLHNIFVKNESISETFKLHSAAKTMHHSYMGGLLEHTLSISKICDFLSSHYENVNRDILIAGAMLHDIGKIYELSPFPLNEYTDDGQLLGHIVMGTELVTREASKIDNFPHQLESMIKHCIISHHGEYEYGSPKRPKTVESFILHGIDDLDAKLKMFEDMISNDKTQGNWVGFQKMLNRNIRKSTF